MRLLCLLLAFCAIPAFATNPPKQPDPSAEADATATANADSESVSEALSSSSSSASSAGQSVSFRETSVGIGLGAGSAHYTGDCVVPKKGRNGRTGFLERGWTLPLLRVDPAVEVDETCVAHERMMDVMALENEAQRLRNESEALSIERLRAQSEFERAVAERLRAESCFECAVIK